jgi:hypothetical protein
MDKIIEYLEMRLRITGAAYEKSKSVQWLRRHQEANVILDEAKRIQRKQKRDKARLPPHSEIPRPLDNEGFMGGGPRDMETQTRFAGPPAFAAAMGTTDGYC